MRKEELQKFLGEYLNMITTPDQKTKKHFICPLCKSGTGKHHTGALTYKTDKQGVPRATCFSCGEIRNSDIFDLIGKVENLNDFNSQYEKAMELFGSQYEKASSKCNTTPIKEKDIVAESITEENGNNEVKPTNFIEFYQEARENITKITYLEDRGIRPLIINGYRIGYVENWKHPNSPQMSPKNGIIIPISKYSYVFRDINATDNNYKYFRVKTSNTPRDKFFNFKQLKYTDSDMPIYITEGEIDALSILGVGQPAVSLGSVANASEFLEACKNLDILSPLVFFMDNDEAGKEAERKIKIKMEEVNNYRISKNLKFIDNTFFEYRWLKNTAAEKVKDPSEALMKLGISFLSTILKAVNRQTVEQIKMFERRKLFINICAINEEEEEKISKKKKEINNGTIKEYLSEKEEEILQIVKKNKKTLLVAPMGTGKTKLIPKINTDPNIVTVIVNPSVAQLQQMEKDYNISAIYGGMEYLNQNIISVTPESLEKKVIEKLEKPFMLIADEAHEMYTNSTFRKSFEDIKKVERLAQSVVYMTATPDVLEEVEYFDATIKIEKEDMPELKTTILEVESLTIDTKIELIKEKLTHSSLVAIHNDNKKENEIIRETLNQELCIKTVLDENFQYNLFGIEPRYKEKTKDTAIAVDASKKDSQNFKKIIEDSQIDNDVQLFCTTSCIQAGLNINNNKETTIIYICNSESFKMVNFLQTIGRYRNKEKIKEVILLKTKKEKSEHVFENFNTIYEKRLKLTERVLIVANNFYKYFKEKYLHTELSRAFGLNFDDENKCYEINYHQIKAQSLTQYNKAFIYFPDILKKELECNTSTKLKVKIEEYKPIKNKEIKEIIKEKKQDVKKKFEEITQKMLDCKDEILVEILNYSLDQRKSNNEPYIELMKGYSEIVSTTFTNTLKSVIEVNEVDKMTAFRYINKFDTLQEVKNQLLRVQIIKINLEIKEKGIDLIFKCFNTYPITIKKVVLIRYTLRDIEKKQARISPEIKQNIAEEAIKLKLYKLKKNEDIKTIINDIEKLINYIYKFDTQRKVQHVNYDNISK